MDCFNLSKITKGLMRKISSDNKVQNHYLIPNKKQLKKGSPSKDVQQPNKKSFVSNNLINFDVNCYPFMNQQAKPQKIYRTSLNLKISTDQLRKLMKLNHPNMINIQKITRGHNKDDQQSHQMEVYFSFYYEVVSYSLKYVALYQDRANNILKKLAEINLTKLLSNLSDYLMKIGVFYLYNLGDIGITKQGQIKVFISPVLFCDDRQLRGDKSMIQVSIQKIVAWWETTIASNTILNPKSSNIVLPSGTNLEEESSLDSIIKVNQSSFIDKEASQLIGDQFEQNKDYRFSSSKESMIKNFPLKNSSNSIQSELSKISTIQINKIKKIDQQIKYIKQRLKNKRMHKESQTFPQKKDKYRNMIQSDRLQRKDLSSDKINTTQSNIVQKIQQNINCINIYTHAKETAPKNTAQLKIKKMTSQPIYSYKISPQNFKAKNSKPKTPVIVHHPTFEPQDFPNSESGDSINTYDMEMQAEIEPAKAVQKNNAFLSQERQISQKNYRPSYDSEHLIERKNQNQVANKHVTQSAGPLQFKNFVNRYIKPQFLAKKSNIYEDPMEYESQTSKSISKKKMKIIADLYETGKSANSHTEKSSSLNQRPQQACYKKKENAYLDSSVERNKNSVPKDSFSRTNSEIKLLPIRECADAQNLRKSKNAHDSKIGERVKLVLQKTKNAIALLNRVKNCKSPPPKLH